MPSVGPESPGWWPSPTSSVSPSSSSCPAACPLYFHSSPWTDLSRRLFIFHTRTPPRGTPPRVFLSSRALPFFFFSYFSFLFKRIFPHRVISQKSFLPPCPSFLPLTRAKFLLLVSIWYGCSLHFFGSFVIDRATGYLTILQEKEEWFGEEQKEILTDGRTKRTCKPIKILHRILQRPWIPWHSYWWVAHILF